MIDIVVVVRASRLTRFARLAKSRGRFLSVPFPSTLAYLHDHNASSNERLTTTPRIVLTVPSAEQLNTLDTGDEQNEVAEGEMDEVQWVEEYGQWGDTSSESDGASDRASLASSFMNESDSTSISSSPPNSPPILTPNVSLLFTLRP